MATKTFTEFRRDTIVTVLPTTLAYGQEVYYQDANDNLTLWVGHADGSAWPSVGYKEIRCSYLIPAGTGGFANRALTVIDNNTGETVEASDVGNGAIDIGLSVTELTIDNAIISIPSKITYSTGVEFTQRLSFTNIGVIQLLNITADYTNAGNPFVYSFTIKVYPS